MYGDCYVSDRKDGRLVGIGHIASAFLADVVAFELWDHSQSQILM